MLQLIKFELYKLISRKLNIVAFAVFILLYSLYLSQLNLTDIEQIRRLHSEWSGPLTEQKVEAARLNEHNLRLDMDRAWEEHLRKSEQGEASPVFEWDEAYRLRILLYSDIINRWERFQVRSAKAAELREEIRHAKAAGRNDFVYRKNIMHYNMLSAIQPPSGDYFRGWGQLIDFANTYGFVILGALMLLALSPVFSEEYAVNMDSLIFSSRHGRRRIVTAKLAASLLIVLSCALILLIINVSVNGMRFGLDGSRVSLQELFKYRSSPFDLSVFKYFLIQQATHIFGAASFSLLILLLSAFSRSSLIPFFVGGAVYGGPFVLTSIFRIEFAFIQMLREYSYGELIMVEGMFRDFIVLNIFGRPVQYLYVMYILFLFISAALLFIIYPGFAKRQVI